MLDIGASELLLTVIIAIVVIGPKDLPRALRTAGQWIGKIRRVSGHFRSGIEEMIRQAELEDMEKKWREKNEAIMRQQAPLPALEPVSPAPASAEAALAPTAPTHAAGAEPPRSEGSADLHGDAHPLIPAEAPVSGPIAEPASPELPLAPPKTRP
jgi:sec-independent protein translocase protein TatB